MFRSLLATLVFTLAGSANAQESGFTTKAPHVVIMDFETGEVLYEKDAREPMAPASMTKIMTANMIFEALKNETITMDTEFRVSEEAWRRGGAASGSSTMYLDVKSSARVEDLIKGIIIQSGNDACIVMAEGLAGSETAFADKMTARAREMGLTSATFRNSTGWPHPEHEISAYDLAQLAQYMITNHPEYYPIYNERSFTWNNIRQGNRNPLLGKFTGADGLKTGSTSVSGYGLVGSAKRGDDRRIIVINGLENKQERSDVANRLMGAAFDQFKVYDLYAKGDIIGKIDIFMGKADNVGVKVDETVIAGLYRGDRSKIRSKMIFKTVSAPVMAGDHIADMVISIPGKEDRVIPLKAIDDVKGKSAIGKAWSVLIRKIRGE
ncbi:D-alanyl-D-alanine carboxypeptidase family protein [Hellea balneolensis]|uniref:D-alanyl-D-alanine carboxypeptidase family protein n=1 Tax=Hellea balneolensis TaxID=287478 RepID=UPI00041E2308|nr:D-alanyl-D-alanine carboxypeptidase family protein [Hellea balneolensis]